MAALPVSRPCPAALVAGLALASCARAPAPTSAVVLPPDTPRGDVVDDYFGTEVADPYRWLEADSPETRAWIEAENAATRAWIDADGARATLRARLEVLWDHARYSAPQKRGGRYFYLRNDGLQDQAVLTVADRLDGEGRALLDPNALSEDGSVALAGAWVSEDGSQVAYAISDGGSDWHVWRVRDVATGLDGPDRLEWIKVSGAAWAPDGSGFYYSRYPAPQEGEALSDLNINNKLYFHAIGTTQDSDRPIYERPDQPRWSFAAQVSEDGRLLVVTAFEGTERKNRVFVADLTVPGAQVEPLLDEFDAKYLFIGNEGDRMWFLTDQGAPRGRVVVVDRGAPERERWVEVLAESADTLESASLLGGKLIATWLHDARTVAQVFSPDGTPVAELALPGLGSAAGFQGRQDDPETFYTYSSFTAPPVLMHVDVPTGAQVVFRASNVPFASDDYETTQAFVPSRDGTPVPVFLTGRKGRTGEAPVLLYGYGGFGIPLTPAFSVQAAAWMELGGVYAVANLRGGGEYGEDWHLAGTRERKQTTFDDLYAVAEWLIATGQTRPAQLAVQGRSNGGLLVGAAVTQRPELFGAALPGVGVLDMLRYHRFTIGWAWASDYGTSEEEEMFPVLLAYSPVHNTRPGTAYPPVLVSTADHDDRVVPAHSYKFAAALQHAQGGSAPVLLRVDVRAGHGAGMSTSRRIDLAADELAFLARALSIEVPAAADQ